MAKTAWPTTTELDDYLTGLGVTTIPTGISLQDMIDAAVDALHDYIGYSPWLETTSATYDYNPPRGRILELGQPMTTVAVNVGKSSTSSGTALTVEVDFWAKPFGGPYTYIEFRDAQYGEPESIAVTGKRGFAASIHLDLWLAVLDYAAAKVYKIAAMSGAVAPGAAVKVKQGMREVHYGSSANGMTTDEKLLKDALRVFEQHRPKGVVGVI